MKGKKGTTGKKVVVKKTVAKKVPVTKVVKVPVKKFNKPLKTPEKSFKQGKERKPVEIPSLALKNKIQTAAGLKRAKNKSK